MKNSINIILPLCKINLAHYWLVGLEDSDWTNENSSKVPVAGLQPYGGKFKHIPDTGSSRYFKNLNSIWLPHHSCFFLLKSKI